MRSVHPPEQHARSHGINGLDHLRLGYSVLGGNAAGNVVASTSTSYLAFQSGNLSTTEGVVQLPVPFAAVVRKLYVITGNSQPASGALTATLRRNGADTNLAATVAANAAAGTVRDLVNAARLNPGDLIDIELTNAASADSAQVRGFSVELVAI